MTSPFARDGWTVTTDTSRFEEASTWFESRIPYTKADYDKLDDATRAKAFYLAGNLELDGVQTIFDELKHSLDKGTPFEDFQKRVNDKLGKLAPDGFHLETVFRNWVQTSYNTGRWYQLQDPAMVLLRPYLMFDAVLDTRTTEICKQCDGTIKLASDPWWLTHAAPLHHRCRSTLRSLRKSEAEKRGVTLDNPGQDVPDGFGKAPPLRGDDLPVPDEQRIDHEVWKAFAERRNTMHVELAKANELAAAERLKRDQRDPAHWLDKEMRAKYGEDAGKAAAWGKAMEHRGRAVPVADAIAQHKQLVSVGAQAGPASTTLFERLHDLDLGDHADVGGLIDALQARAATGADVAYELSELKTTAALIGHAESITAGAAIEFAEPVWQGRWGKAAKAKLIAEHRDAAKFLSALTDESVLRQEIVITARKGRAEYTSGKALGGVGKIGLGGREFAGDLVHEWGHSLEDVGARVGAAARGFLDARTVNEPLRRLRDLTSKTYSIGELAKKDGFYDPYMGKYYRFGATEITSMGIELVRTQNASKLYSHDPDHFYLVLGILAGGKVP